MKEFTDNIIQEAISIFSKDNVEISSNKRNLTIRFPEIIIENEIGEKHKILDLFFRFKIESGQIDLTGTRTTFSHAEIYCRYAHSHLDFCKAGEFANWCLGTTMQELVSNYNNEEKNKEDVFILILNTLPTYVSSESIEGGPYQFSRNVYRYNGDNQTDFYIDNFLDLPKSNIVFNTITEFSQTRIVCSDVVINEELVKFLKGLNLDIFLPGYSAHFKQSISKEFLENAQDYDVNERSFISFNKFIEFNGEKIYCKAVNNYIPEDLTNDSDIIADDTKKHLIELINDRMTINFNDDVLPKILKKL